MSAAEEVEAVARALRRSRLYWGVHADRYSDEEWLSEFFGEAAQIALAALAPIREAEVLAAQDRAWEKGYSAGWADCGDQDAGGDPTDTPNPYRGLAATHDEGGE